MLASWVAVAALPVVLESVAELALTICRLLLVPTMVAEVGRATPLIPSTVAALEPAVETRLPVWMVVPPAPSISPPAVSPVPVTLPDPPPAGTEQLALPLPI